MLIVLTRGCSADADARRRIDMIRNGTISTQILETGDAKFSDAGGKGLLLIRECAQITKWVFTQVFQSLEYLCFVETSLCHKPVPGRAGCLGFFTDSAKSNVLKEIKDDCNACAPKPQISRNCYASRPLTYFFSLTQGVQITFFKRKFRLGLKMFRS